MVFLKNIFLKYFVADTKLIAVSVLQLPWLCSQLRTEMPGHQRYSCQPGQQLQQEIDSISTRTTTTTRNRFHLQQDNNYNKK